MKRIPRIEPDTDLLPDFMAWCVWDDARVWLGCPLPRCWVRELTAKAATVYARNAKFRRGVRRKDERGRDYLLMFLRHWLAALLKARRPQLFARLPPSYSRGEELPDRRHGFANGRLCL